MYLAGKPRRIGKYRLKAQGHIRFASGGRQEEGVSKKLYINTNVNVNSQLINNERYLKRINNK